PRRWMYPLSLHDALPILGLDVERGEAADRGALLAVMVDAGRQGDLAAQVRGLDLEAGELVMLGHRLVHVVDEHEVRLARLDARRDRKSTRLNSSHLGISY